MFDPPVGVSVIKPATSRKPIAFAAPSVFIGTTSFTGKLAAPRAGTEIEVLPGVAVCGEPAAFVTEMSNVARVVLLFLMCTVSDLSKLFLLSSKP